MPADWRQTWNASSQWGVFGNQHWPTKYGAAGFIPHMLEQSPFLTRDWRRANASIVVLFARHYGGGPAITQLQCLRRLERRSAAFRATRGANHFFIFTDSRGPCCIDGHFKDVDFLKYRIIGPHAEPPAEEGPSFVRTRTRAPPIRCFDERKDVGIPTPNIHFPRTPFARALGRGAEPLRDATVTRHATANGAPLRAAGGASRADAAHAAPARDLLLFYAGWNYDHRMKLVKALQADPDPQVLVRREITPAEYKRAMLRARFCPICGGFSQWTPRLAEALYYGCVPVLISRHLQPPFADILDWSRFSVRPSPVEVETVLAYPAKLKAELRKLDYESLAQGVRAARGALQYHLGRYTGRDMLPLLLFQMGKRLATPLEPPATIHALAEDIDPEHDYDEGLNPEDKSMDSLAAHQVAAHAELAVDGVRWQCATYDGSLCPCMHWDPAKDSALREVVAAANRAGESSRGKVSFPASWARHRKAQIGRLWAQVGQRLAESPAFQQEESDRRFVGRYHAALKSHFDFITA